MHIKTANTKTNVHDLIKKRWSARSFSPKQLSEDDVQTILEAGTWAASSMNEQPWKYLYAMNGTKGFDRMHSCLMTGNQPWSKNGSVLMISLAKKNFEYKGRINRHAMHDMGAANSTLLLQAADMDVYGHMIGGFDMQKTLEEFNIDSEKWEIACFIVLGYLDDAEKLNEPFLSREKKARTRRSVSEISTKI